MEGIKAWGFGGLEAVTGCWARPQLSQTFLHVTVRSFVIGVAVIRQKVDASDGVKSLPGGPALRSDERLKAAALRGCTRRVYAEGVGWVSFFV